MEEITQEQFDNAKNVALDIFRKNKKIASGAFGTVKITPDWFDHIEWKSLKHKRAENDAFVRYLCFQHVPYILKESKLFQEYREQSETLKVKNRKWVSNQNKIVTYYGFVAVVKNWKNRVKVVVKKVDGWDSYELVSVIPAWRNEDYTNIIFFDEDTEHLDAKTKKAIQEEKGWLL